MSTAEQTTENDAVLATPLPAQGDTIPILATDDLVEVTVALPSIIVNPLADADMESIVLTDAAETAVAVNRKSQVSRLKEIKGNPIAKLNVSSLRIFCQRVGLKGQRKKSKFDICVALVESIATGAWKEWSKEK